MKQSYQLDDDVAVHQIPAWKEQANFIVRANISEDGGRRKWEQLWTRQINDFRFELCCIPFFIYDLALGDEIETDSQYVLQRVVKPSGHYTFRAWFGESADLNVRDEVIQMMQHLGCALEWSSENLVAIDAGTDALARDVADFLYGYERLSRLVYETGRTK